ncbi:WG repeat-containing protein [Micromonospora sonneratiae]
MTTADTAEEALPATEPVDSAPVSAPPAASTSSEDEQPPATAVADDSPPATGTADGPPAATTGEPETTADSPADGSVDEDDIVTPSAEEPADTGSDQTAPATDDDTDDSPAEDAEDSVDESLPGTTSVDEELPEVSSVDEPPAEDVPEDSATIEAAAAPGDAPVSAPPVAEASPDTVLPGPDGPAAGAATALRAPTMLAPIVQPDEAEETAPAEPEPVTAKAPAADPEQVLASYDWRFHHETLRELVEDPDELRAIRDRLTEKVEPATDNRSRARLLSLRAVVSRILGDLGKALADGKLALAHAEATGELRRIAIAQARLAHVHQWRGEFTEADRLFEEANSSELPDRLRATMHEHAGRSCYDQGRYIEACNHFERALELRKVEDPDLIARTELALDAVFDKVAQNGWGPYPRTRDEILQVHRPPVPRFNEKVQRWGYLDPDGQQAVAPSYADAQPFRDGVAWVRRPEVQTWELIDETGELLIDSSSGYLGVGSFSDGVAWVTRDGTGTWIVIDKANKVVVATGYDDVRPFRRGVAAVCRDGGWGAIDKSGRVVLPTRYSGFSTALTDGRYLDGFTEEGLAIVETGGRKGVVDRSGRIVVPPAHPALVIHPVAFLIGDGTGRWGALDRRGEELIDVTHASRADVMDEIDRLLADTKPVL